jgi:hypothetical protein
MRIDIYKEDRMQLNVYMDKELAEELRTDAIALQLQRGEITSRQDVLKLAHRAWKNLQANAKPAPAKKGGKQP